MLVVFENKSIQSLHIKHIESRIWTSGMNKKEPCVIWSTIFGDEYREVFKTLNLAKKREKELRFKINGGEKS